VEELTEDIQSVQEELRSCIQQRTTLETKKNNLENVLGNDLLKSEAELQRELEDISLSDKQQQLEMTNTELHHLDATIVQNQARYGGV
jgi:chromosome segregation ATPase